MKEFVTLLRVSGSQYFQTKMNVGVYFCVFCYAVSGNKLILLCFTFDRSDGSCSTLKARSSTSTAGHVVMLLEEGTWKY